MREPIMSDRLSSSDVRSQQPFGENLEPQILTMLTRPVAVKAVLGARGTFLIRSLPRIRRSAQPSDPAALKTCAVRKNLRQILFVMEVGDMARLTLQLGSALVVPFGGRRRPVTDWRSRSFAEAVLNLVGRRLDSRRVHRGEFDCRQPNTLCDDDVQSLVAAGAR